MQARYYQVDAKNAAYEFLATKHGNPLICMPTGTGKGFVIADMIRDVMSWWPNQRILALTHVKQLIEQNSQKLKELWPSAPFGIYSAGLKKRELNWPITFGGVASAVGVAEKLGHIDLLLIDEAHLLSPKSDTMYGQVIAELTRTNPYLRVVGFTATPYRLGLGLLTNGTIFTDICYNITERKAFNKLIEEGFISPLVPKHTKATFNLSNVGISSGDYNQSQLEEAVDSQDINYQVCCEMVELASSRSTWLVFASGIKHSDHIAAMLNNFGIPSFAVHSKKPQGETDAAIKAFREGKLRCVVTNNFLTTGFDCPAIDFIGMLRPTISTGLWVQMLGRGTRPSPDTMKQNCLVLDFARNTERLGPINQPVIPRMKGDGPPGVPPIRICDSCGAYNHASARVCDFCGHEFPTQTKLEASAATHELIASDFPQLEWFKVHRALYTKHVPDGKPPLLKVTYVCGKRSFNEFVCLQHSGYAAIKARKWWKDRMKSDEAPPNVDEALKWTQMLPVPKRVEVHTNRKYPMITRAEL